MTTEHERAVRRHTTRCRNELERIIAEAQFLHKQLERGQYRGAETIVSSAVTVTERMAILETLKDVAEWQAAEGGDDDVASQPQEGSGTSGAEQGADAPAQVRAPGRSAAAAAADPPGSDP